MVSYCKGEGMYIRTQCIDHFVMTTICSGQTQLFTTANPITATCFDSHQAFFRMYTMIYQLKHVAVFGSATVREVFVRCACLCWCFPKNASGSNTNLIAFCSKTALVHRTHTNTPTLRKVWISWQALQCMLRTGFVHSSVPHEIRLWVSKRLRALTILWLYGTHYRIMGTVLTVCQHLQLLLRHSAAPSYCTLASTKIHQP